MPAADAVSTTRPPVGSPVRSAAARRYRAAWCRGAACPFRWAAITDSQSGWGHVDQVPVEERPGAADQRVDPPERVHRAVDEALGARPGAGVVGAGDRATTRPADLVDDVGGRGTLGRGPVEGDAEVVDDHGGALGGQGEGGCSPEPATPTGDDHHAALTETRGWSWWTPQDRSHVTTRIVTGSVAWDGGIE